MKRWLWIFSFLGILCLGQLTQAASPFNIQTQDPGLKKDIESLAEKASARISSFLDDSITHPLTIYVAEDEEEFKSKLGSDFPDWGIGAAIPARHLIVLKSPAKFHYARPFSEVLEHELAHIFLAERSRGATLPRWMDEGFAMMQSKEWRIGQDLRIAMANLTGSIIPLSQIENLNGFSDSKAGLAYTESYLALSYFLEAYGKEGFFRFLDLLSSGESLDLTFFKTTGSSYLGFQEEFADYLKKKYNFFAVLGDTFLLWLGLAFLLVFLYLIKRYYNRKTLKRWEYEDRIGKYGSYEEDQTQD